MKRGTIEHPKMRRLARELGVPLIHAVGLVEATFHFVGRCCPRGDIGKFTNQDIAEGCYWTGEPDKFIAAMLASGWLDQSSAHRLLLHDWSDHCEEGIRRALLRESVCTFADRKPVRRKSYDDVLSNQKSDKGSTNVRPPSRSRSRIRAEANALAIAEAESEPPAEPAAEGSVSPSGSCAPPVLGSDSEQPEEQPPEDPAPGNGLGQQFVLTLLRILGNGRPAENKQQQEANITCAAKIFRLVNQGACGPPKDFIPVMWARASDIARTADRPWGAFMGYIKGILKQRGNQWE